MDSNKPHNILDSSGINRTIERMAYQIVEQNGGTAGLALVGVIRKGDYIAGRIRDAIKRFDGAHIPLGRLDITLYRDDIATAGPTPLVRKTDIPFDITGLTLVLVDDVCYTGRTVRAALDALMDFGRPRAVRFASLIDRGGRELPIQPDYTGHCVEIRAKERVMVEMAEDGHEDRVFVMGAPDGWKPGED
jgi:pyrimidine operon attenuation protein/uracil phosphoribosyltransferase